MQLSRKTFRWAILYAVVLALAAGYVLLDTFVIPRSLTLSATAETDVSEEQPAETAAVQAETAAVITDTSYEDENIRITIETEYVYDTAVYIADIQIADASYLETALANGIYGRNIKETTSDMAESNDAIFTVNGDYYGFRNTGYVIRNGVLYRAASGGNEDLVIDGDGNFSIT